MFLNVTFLAYLDTWMYDGVNEWTFTSLSKQLRSPLKWPRSLSFKQRIEYKICMLVYKCRRNEAPAYLVEMLHPVVPSARDTTCVLSSRNCTTSTSPGQDLFVRAHEVFLCPVQLSGTVCHSLLKRLLHLTLDVQESPENNFVFQNFTHCVTWKHLFVHDLYGRLCDGFAIKRRLWNIPYITLHWDWSTRYCSTAGSNRHFSIFCPNSDKFLTDGRALYLLWRLSQCPWVLKVSVLETGQCHTRYCSISGSDPFRQSSSLTWHCR